MREIGHLKLFLILFITIAGCRSSDNTVVDPGENKNGEKVTNLEYVTGFPGQYRYAYCPSVMVMKDGTRHMFFCGNPVGQVYTDNIYHIKISADGIKTEAKSVLQPGTDGEWDDQHVCDPAIIAGQFRYNGVDYGYALFYLGTRKEYYYNEIGVAFSNDPETETWIKYSGPLIKKTWEGEGDQQSGSSFSWGVGQPSVISLDHKGKILIAYTIGDIDGTRIEWSVLEMSDMDHLTIQDPVRMVSTGLKDLYYTGDDITKDTDFALDTANNVIYGIRSVQPDPSSYPAFICQASEIDSINIDKFLSSAGEWYPVTRINPSLTGYPRNHNAALERNMYGYLTNTDSLHFYYTVSKEYPEVSSNTGSQAEWTYCIWQGTLHLKKDK